MIRARHLRSVAAPLVVLAALAAALAGCSSTVSLPAPPDANDPLCAQIMAQLPSSVAGQQRRWTDAQSTGAWGDPAAVLFSCGVTPPGPTTLRCIQIGGVDWVVDESDAPRYRITSFGRTPAVQLYVDNDTVSPNDVLDQFGRLIAGRLPQNAQCTDPETATPDLSSTPTPTPTP
ncbi:DUF3515 family protein [Microbacterium sp. X-17]|uniref:DUF3515 family protein n=1 Tax=Microbacterium sp. X-17 TaxID=3144404 RepID=UPI0031F50392